MSIPHINKIKVLAKISPPLATPGPASPAQAIRGAIVAVDGADSEVVKGVVKYLSDFLSKSDEYTVRVFEGPAVQRPSPDGAPNSFVNYLQTFSEWHSISAQIVKYITDIPAPASPSPVSPKTIPVVGDKANTPPHESSSPKADEPRPITTSPPTPPASTSYPIPIALIPHYQLSHTDASASTIPITDAYAPVDHWQWMATLWRGIVGPDVTVVIKDSSVLDNKDDASRLGAGTGVEVRLADARAIVMRSGENGVQEGALRRVGFEVGEWVRGLGEREERRESLVRSRGGSGGSN